MSDIIDFHECCRIILSDWRFRRQETVPMLRDYKRNLLMLLNQDFSITWNDDRPDFEPLGKLSRLACTMPRDYVGLSSLMNAYEYDALPAEWRVLDRHKDELHAAEEAVRQQWIGLFHDLLLLRWPKAARVRTSWTRLRSLGLGEDVDEAEFF